MVLCASLPGGGGGSGGVTRDLAILALVGIYISFFVAVDVVVANYFPRAFQHFIMLTSGVVVYSFCVCFEYFCFIILLKLYFLISIIF